MFILSILTSFAIILFLLYYCIVLQYYRYVLYYNSYAHLHNTVSPGPRKSFLVNIFPLSNNLLLICPFPVKQFLPVGILLICNFGKSQTELSPTFCSIRGNLEIGIVPLLHLHYWTNALLQILDYCIHAFTTCCLFWRSCWLCTINDYDTTVRTQQKLSPA